MLKFAIITLCLFAVTPAFGQTVVSDGPDVPDLAILDQTMFDFMDEYEVPASQLAVTWQGRLVYSRAFSNNEEVPPDTDTLFRIGSVSKPITSTLIHRAHQDGLLSVDDTIDQYLDMRQFNGASPADSRLPGVTIRNLLEHLGGLGGGTDYGFDPLSNDHAVAQASGDGFPVLRSQILKYMNGVSLINEPGETYVYANFGFFLLGQILESATGMPYGAYADSVFNPIGIWRARQSRSQFERRFSNEIKYPLDRHRTSVLDNSGEMLPLAYGALNSENRAAPGGWLSTATDLARWLVNLQNPQAPDAILNEQTTAMMFGLPENYPGDYTLGDYYYGSGWQLRDYGGGNRTFWHSGSYVSAESQVVSYQSGLAWTVIFNTRIQGQAGQLLSEFASVFAPVVTGISQFPTHDLFDSLLTPTPPNVNVIAAGSWFDLSHNGEGFTVTFINASLAVVYWFTYDRKGNQRWYFGIATVDGTRLVIEDLLTSSGGLFGPNYDPAQVEITSVGSLVLNFNAEGRAKADYLLEGESGYLDLIRLSQPFTSADPASAGDWRNSLIFDPSHDGEGYVVEVLPNGRVVVYWFTYDNIGKQAWMIGTLAGDFDDGVALPMVLTAGGNFGVGFDPDNVQVLGNGKADMTIVCGGPMTVSFSGGSSKFPAVDLNLQLLGGYVAPPCE